MAGSLRAQLIAAEKRLDRYERVPIETDSAERLQIEVLQVDDITDAETVDL